MQPSLTPWHEVVDLRHDLKTGELSLAVFAADLYDVVMQKGHRIVYEDPREFFALTYPTYRLRELVKEVVLRLAGRSDKAYRTLSVNYGGGKTHTLIALKHLVSDPARLPSAPAVEEFKAHIGGDAPLPPTRVASLCFDKIDLEKGAETPGPDGTIRQLRYPWSILAFQLAGAQGLRLIHAEGEDAERATPPAEPLLTELLACPQAEGLSTLVLQDEVLMYVRGLVEHDPNWRGRLINFFQYLGQAVVKVDRCAMVTSLLASDQRQSDALGQELLAEIANVLGRQNEEDASPVSKEDIAEVLRRRFFAPDSIREPSVFRPHVTSVVSHIAGLDEQTRKARQVEEDRYLKSYPFHPDLTEILYARWTQLPRFQRTRGILRTFAVALRNAAQWDASPLAGPNIFLNAPGENDLAEAAGELASYASVDDGEGNHQQWKPILEGELSKAQEIQTKMIGLHNRELEQAVIAVFLSSQPIGQKALTRELLLLLGPAQPDKIELEKALRRWTEISWFLDEVEVGTGGVLSGGTYQLPKAWRLGNRPNLRQMHHEACDNRVLPASVEDKLVSVIRETKELTSRAAGADVKTHNLPQHPRSIGDDGAFRYAVLGPQAASEPNHPSEEAQRFINETTGPDRPRHHRNAVILAVPARDGLEAARTQIRAYLGWLEVRSQLKNQAIDAARARMLGKETETARQRIPEAVKQAYSIVVTVNENNVIAAFQVTVTDEPLFMAVKADPRARIQETAISAEALAPDGPYDLWREGETSRRVKDLVGAFAQNPALPKMLRQKEILNTILHGVESGVWVAQITRPDRSHRTFWRGPIDEPALQDPGLEIFLPEAATLSELAPELLAYQKLPGLWAVNPIRVQDAIEYFEGGREVTIPKEGYEDQVKIPRCGASQVEEAIAAAVEQGLLWLTHGPTSLLRETVPDGILSPSAMLQPPPDPILIQDLMPEALSDVWRGDKANALDLQKAISSKLDQPLPWFTVRTAIDSGIQARWIELSDPGATTWPCTALEAQHVVLQLPQSKGTSPPPPPPPSGKLRAEADLDTYGIQELGDQIGEIAQLAVGHKLEFRWRIRLEVEKTPELTPEAIKEINARLSEVSEQLQLPRPETPS